MNPPRHRHDESTAELPPVITEKARVSLPLAVLLPCLITLAGALIWATKFYIGQVETQAHVVKLETTLTDIQRHQEQLERQAQQIQADIVKIRASLGPPISGITKTTPTIDLFTTEELPQK